MVFKSVMTHGIIILLRNKEDSSVDPLTDLLCADARKLILDAVKAELQILLGHMQIIKISRAPACCAKRIPAKDQKC